MKAFDLEELAHREGGEYVLGMKDLHSQACYLIFGILTPGEAERLVRPGAGHEEILCAVGGPLLIHTQKGEIRLERGSAVHVREDQSFMISNPGDKEIVYIISGGNSCIHD
ncbi:MAG: hypothetical protein HY912_16240 [Desulfomonile tiedjei]|uniref:Cupin domain-containing protein n=1 Tax=Desulfomonile tiedjei TaxID=2358 RepID=A0A9D6Z4K6_9BACT|nr:hypothetical protein [Desulfomonile tiedjei]